MPISPQQPLPFGQLERPTTTNDAGIRVDFDAQEFDHAVANHGYRLIWTRRAECPCRPLDFQLTQPNPNCSFCSGTGYLYFGPDQPQDLSAQNLTPIQQAAVAKSGGFLIYGIMQPLSAQDKRNDRLGGWMMGGSQVTVMWQNQLGFRDRLINLDSLYPYTETTVVPALPDRYLPLRYLVTPGIYLLQDENGKRYHLNDDYTLDVGRILFNEGTQPIAGTRMSCFYLTYPVFLVEDINHRSRIQLAKSPLYPQVSPEGGIQQLPIQARLSLEFIPSLINAGGGE